MRIQGTCLMLGVAIIVCGSASGVVVNADFEAGLVGDQTYAGDDAALSSPGGTTWTSVLFPGAVDLVDEFGGNTPFDIEILDNFTQSNAAAENDLQDSGAAAAINVVGLVPGALYTIAGYVDTNGGFSVTDASGFIDFFGFGAPAADGWSLPGTEGDGGDYFLVSNLEPFEITPGKWGIELGLDGTLTGLQISGLVPEPSSLVMLGVVSLLIGRRYRSGQLSA